MYKESSIRESIHQLVEGAIHFGSAFSSEKLITIMRGVVDMGARILHGETTRTHGREAVSSFDEPQFAELPETSNS